jgi:hypothetical protein
VHLARDHRPHVRGRPRRGRDQPLPLLARTHCP